MKRKILVMGMLLACTTPAYPRDCLDSSGVGTLACGAVGVLSAIGITVAEVVRRNKKSRIDQLKNDGAPQTQIDSEQGAHDGLVVGVGLCSVALVAAVAIGIGINVLPRATKLNT